MVIWVDFINLSNPDWITSVKKLFYWKHSLIVLVYVKLTLSSEGWLSSWFWFSSATCLGMKKWGTTNIYDCNYDILYLLLSSDFHKEQSPQKNSEPSNQMENVLKLDHSEPDVVKKNMSLTEGKHVLITKPITISSPNHPSTEHDDPAPTPDILSIFWSEQRQIQEQVRRVCQQGGGSLRRQINPYMFSYSREYNLLYWRNQKVLSS